MDKADYDKLTWELSKVCNRYHPSKGPHKPEELYQHFDLERFAEQDKNIERRAAALEALTRQGLTPQQVAAASERENLYYDDRQRIIDRTIDDAERETCKANGIPQRSSVKEHDRKEEPEMSHRSDEPKAQKVNVYDRQREDISRQTKEAISQSGGEAVNRANFVNDVPKLPSKPKDLPEPMPPTKPLEQPVPKPQPARPWFLQAPDPQTGPAPQAQPPAEIKRQDQTRVVTPATKRDIPGRVLRDDFER